jgi:hypothetical protein
VLTVIVVHFVGNNVTEEGLSSLDARGGSRNGGKR